ncbi:hypothetical protein FSP39_014465 [Pinctada imbricata]|uniref:Protein zwilch n=1 Tax=Pinctada imbricata TaxID=66713 RepID=A0AA89C3J1_PINIB|nr:hypothetical protein FSP39_014465 [Pinctada imbricata]
MEGTKVNGSDVKDSLGSPGYDGSPLKLQLIADLSSSSISAFTEENQDARPVARVSRYGIKCNIAKTLAAWMNNINLQVEHQLPQLVIFCNGNDIANTAVLMVESTMGYIKGTKVTMRGQILEQDLQNEFKNIHLNEKHLVYRAKHNIADKMMEYPGLFMLEVEWTKSFQIPPLDPPPPDARAEIKAQIVIGKNMAYFNFYKQLAMLNSLIHGLETGEVDWLVKDTDYPAKERVKELVKRLKLGDADLNATVNKDMNDNATNGQEEIMNCLEMNFDQERKDYDFTDHLWSILCQCVSYQDCVEALEYVFDVLRNGDLNPLVHRYNTTTMAEMVRESYCGKLRVPNLAGLYPIQLLAEMGAEKLRQDYVYMLLSKDLVTLGQLQSLIDTKGTLKKKYSCLERLHAVAEMIIMLNLYLQIPYAKLSSCAKDMLQHYEQNQLNPKHVFTFTMPANLLKGELELKPCHWEMEATRRLPNIVASTKYILRTSQPFPHVEARPVGSQNGHITSEGSESDIAAENYYYFIKKEESLNYMK